VPGTWLREEQADLAVQKILDGAARAFVGRSPAGARDDPVAGLARE